MSEYWQSTPKYWCKHCSTYVRDTKLERQNHEATGKHQGAVKRSLRDLHRGKENEDREKERAKREIERLNGVVSGKPPSSSRLNNAPGAPGAATGGGLSEGERKRQAEQLALLGVSVPQEFRGDMAMAGEWSVTATTIVDETKKEEGPEARARGVHKRERTEDEQEEEKAVRKLLKKPKNWGRDPRLVDGEDDLDALLNGGLVVKKADDEENEKTEGVKKEEGGETPVKTEPEDVAVKKEEAEEGSPPVEKQDIVKDEVGGVTEEVTPVVAFKKRKPKNIRQK